MERRAPRWLERNECRGGCIGDCRRGRRGHRGGACGIYCRICCKRWLEMAQHIVEESMKVVGKDNVWVGAEDTATVVVEEAAQGGCIMYCGCCLRGTQYARSLWRSGQFGNVCARCDCKMGHLQSCGSTDTRLVVAKRPHTTMLRVSLW